MTFQVNSEISKNLAKITMSGELDTNTAPAVQAEVQKAINAKVKRLAFLVQDLEYISSAGLRIILFAKQKLGSDIYWISPSESVMDVLQIAGFDQVVKVRDTYNPAEIENI